MIATLSTLSSSGFVPPLRWAVAEFHELRSQPRFLGRRAILLRGVIREQGPMKPPHAVAIELVTEILPPLVPKGFRVRAQLPLVLSLETDPIPDFAIVTGSPRDSLADHPSTAALVVEISDTTLMTDTTEKAELYATAGILDYWVLDLNSRQLLVFRDPLPLPAGLGATAYRTHLTFGLNDSVSPLVLPAVSIRVADLLP